MRVEAMAWGCARSLFQAAQAASMIALKVSNTRLESQVWPRSCHTASTGFSSGAREGRTMSVMSSDRRDCRSYGWPARSRGRTACAPRATALGNETLQVDPAPAHDTMHGPIGPVSTGRASSACWSGDRRGGLCRSTSAPQSVRVALVEAVNSITQRLPVHAADLHCFGPAHPVQDGRQRQQASAPACILRSRGKSTEFTRREIRPHAHRCWHGANAPRTMKSARRTSRKAREARSEAAGTRRCANMMCLSCGLP